MSTLIQNSLFFQRVIFHNFCETFFPAFFHKEGTDISNLKVSFSFTIKSFVSYFLKFFLPQILSSHIRT